MSLTGAGSTGITDAGAAGAGAPCYARASNMHPFELRPQKHLQLLASFPHQVLYPHVVLGAQVAVDVKLRACILPEILLHVCRLCADASQHLAVQREGLDGQTS